jgi:hypothetical protein
MTLGFLLFLVPPSPYQVRQIDGLGTDLVDRMAEGIPWYTPSKQSPEYKTGVFLFLCSTFTRKNRAGK